MNCDRDVVNRVLELLRQFGWEAGAGSLERKIAEAANDLERQALQHFTGWIAAERGEFDEAIRHFDELGRIPELAGWAKLGLGFVAMRSRDLDRARQLFAEAESTAGDDPALIGSLRLMTGTTLFHQGKVEQALEPLEEAVKQFGPDCFSRGRALDALGMWYATRDNFQAALDFFRQALDHKQQFDDEPRGGG